MQYGILTVMAEAFGAAHAFQARKRRNNSMQMVTKTVAAMAQTVFCADLQDNIELQSRLMQSVLDAETETAAFIEQFGLQELNLAAVRTCKLQFLEWNQKLLLQIQKIQSYGYHLDEIAKAVQLEILTLSKELPLLK